MAPTPLEARVLALCDALEQADPAAFGAVAHDVRTGLGGRLRLAVVGRVNAGKSTLVNALIGRRVAPTDDAECTRIVTHYTAGFPESGTVVLRDGTSHPFALEHGALPRALPWPPEQIAYAEVRLQAAALEHFTLIDTPGLGTRTAANVATTRSAVLGDGGERQADALIYVFRDLQFADDVAFLTEFAAVASRDPRRAGSIGVLSHADAVGDPWSDDPLTLAHALAARIAAERADHLGTVVPIAGLLAESALTGRVTEPVAARAAALAAHADVDLRYPTDAVAAEVAALRPVLTDDGLRRARGVASGGARALRDWLVARSGIAGLSAALAARYVGRFPQLKAARAIDALHDAARATGHPHRFDRIFSEADLHPAMHPLHELGAWERLTARAPRDPLVPQLERLLAARTDAERVGGLPADAPRDVVIARARTLESDARAAAATSLDQLQAATYRTLTRSWGIIAAAG